MSHSQQTAPMSAQRGTVLLFTLISLVVMLVAAVGLIRSFNTSLFNAGNLAFRRDLQNQADWVVPQVLDTMTVGALANPLARGNHLPAENYSATRLASNVQGIPDALLNDSLFSSVASAQDLKVTQAGEENGVTVRYLIDRQCRSVGNEAILGPDNCVVSPDSGASPGGSGSERDRAEFGAAGAAAAASAAGATGAGTAASAAGAGAIPPQIIYRLSIRMTGPRKTQAFYQTTFTL